MKLWVSVKFIRGFKSVLRKRLVLLNVILNIDTSYFTKHLYENFSIVGGILKTCTHPKEITESLGNTKTPSTFKINIKTVPCF